MTARLLGPTVAGTWYAGNREGLEQQLDDLLKRGAKAAKARAGSSVTALIAPHAGYVYSGVVAGAGFHLMHGRVCERVLLLGPSHYAGFQGGAVPSAERYRTPVGDVPLDTDVIAQLAECPGLHLDDEPFLPEHSLEAEIPFLQRTLAAGWRLVPILIGGGSSGDATEEVADAVRDLLTPETVIVISSDFTHYGPRFHYVPFDTEVPRRLEQLDMGAVDRILAWDADGFEDYVKRTGATICGHKAIDVLLRLFPDKPDVSLIAYDTSGSITGFWDHSVSYASLAVSRTHE